MRNPFLSFWLSAANAWAGAARGFWTAEMQRQQTRMLSQMMEQAMVFWSGGWLQPGRGSPRKPPRR
jgi:hypothetical protein